MVGTLALGLGSVGVTGASLKMTAIKAIGFVEERLWDAELAAAGAGPIAVPWTAGRRTC
jgi:hypothetical protein